MANPTPGSRPAWVDDKLPPFESQADRDCAFGDRELARWQRTLQSQRTRILEGAGHFLQDDAPDEICAEIRAWRPPT